MGAWDLLLQRSTPIELYRFTTQTRAWYYTSAAYEVTYEGDTYKPSSIKRSSIKNSINLLNDGVSLVFPLGDEFASQFIGFAPEELFNVEIFRDDGSEDWELYWPGRIVAVKVERRKISIECMSNFSTVRRPGLRARYEYQCRHALYSGRCGLSDTSWRVTGSVIGGSDSTIIVGEAGVYDDGYFTGGKVTLADGSARFIVDHVDDNIELNRPFENAPTGLLVYLFAGCDHQFETCRDKFSNQDNYGGFPYIPDRTPFNGSSIE